MKNLIHIISIISFAFLFSCSGGKVNTYNSPNKEIVVETPTQEQINEASKNNSIPLGGDSINIPAPVVVKEECDDIDNDKDGLIDEGCFGCCVGAKKGDFDCDGTVTMYDCGCPVLIAYGKTTMKNGISCADLDRDGKVGFGDMFKCLEIYNGVTQ